MADRNSVLSTFERLQPRDSLLARQQFPRRRKLENLQFITTTGRLISWGKGSGPTHVTVTSIYATILYIFLLASFSLFLWILFPCPPLLPLQDWCLFSDVFISPAFHVISDFRREAAEICTLLSCCAAISGNLVPKFRDNLSVQSRNPKIAPIGCAKTSVRNHHSSLRNNPEERSSVLPYVIIFPLKSRLQPYEKEEIF